MQCTVEIDDPSTELIEKGTSLTPYTMYIDPIDNIVITNYLGDISVVVDTHDFEVSLFADPEAAVRWPLRTAPRGTVVKFQA